MEDVNKAASATFAFLGETYDTERLKTLSVWSQFADSDLAFRPEPRARSVHEQFVHQCMSEDAWFTKMLGIGTGAPVLPERETRLAFIEHYASASATRLDGLRSQVDAWFSGMTMFFNVERSRAWVLVRRVAHSAHHRGQLTTYHRLLSHPLYSTYGPTADTGGLAANGGAVIYRYESIDDLLEKERTGGVNRPLLGPGDKPLSERP